jgi:ABC-type polysaccharide/polyol phosphate transport system ATPase subunit/ABC-type polysaccharide/polyol phosphate export permease
LSRGITPVRDDEESASGPSADPVEGRSAAISISGASKTFRLPHQLYITLKERISHPFRRYTYDALGALHDISFEVRHGEFFGVVGPNGSGKSTLLRCVAGIYALDQGEIVVDGRVSPFIELGAGFTDDLAARDNVVVNCIILGLSRREAQRRVDDILALAELEQFTDLPLKNYSSGMRARLGFAIAVQTDAPVLLVDEVLAVGDASFQEKCFRQFQEAKASGRTTLLVTHDMKVIERFCDRALLLDRGRIVDIGEPHRIAAGYEALGARTESVPMARTEPLPAMDKPRAARTQVRAGLLGPAAIGDDPRGFAALVRALAEMQFKLHYLGSMLGYAWSVLRPLMMFGVLYFVLSQVLSVGAGVAHFPLYLLTTIVLWTFFAEATSSAVTCLVMGRGLLRKARFPRLAVPFAAVLSALINLGINLIVVAAFIVGSGVAPRLSWLELPLLVLFLVVLATGVGTLLSALYARYRDVGQIWAVALQMLFYLSPVLYVTGRYPESLRSVLAANPLAIVFTQARHALIDPSAPSAAASVGGTPALIAPLAIVGVLLVVGVWLFSREAPRIAERL